MSEPVSNAEIEDVLSSIRRLVSGEPGGARRVHEETKTKEDDRFVLTPALRVPDEDIAEDEAATAPPTARRGLSYDQSLEQRIAELESVIAQSSGEWEPDGSDADAGDAAEPLDVMASPEAIFAADEERTPQAESADTETDAPTDTGAAETWPDDEDNLWEDEEPGATAFEPETEHDDGSSRPDEALHADLSGADETVFADRAAPSASEAADDLAASADAADGTGDAREDGDGVGLADEGMLIDEEALRQLVTDIVRDELQGALGERITRNVRRLVRREVQRALASRDLDGD